MGGSHAAQEHGPLPQKYSLNAVYPATGLSAARVPTTRIWQEPLTLAELSIMFSSTPLLFCCRLLPYVATIER